MTLPCEPKESTARSARERPPHMDSAASVVPGFLFRPVPPVVIGLLGGVAAGKSTVSGMFAAHGIVVLDADKMARALTEQPDVVAAIAARFGKGVLDPAGRLARARLAELVFREPESRSALEAIIHPRVRAALVQGVESALANGKSVLLDVPLLLENGPIDLCDVCIFVEVSDSTRAQRAKARGWDEGELARREASQADLTLKKSRCAYTIHNDGSLADTSEQVRSILEHLGRTPRPLL